MLHIPSPKGTE